MKSKIQRIQILNEIISPDDRLLCLETQMEEAK